MVSGKRLVAQGLSRLIVFGIIALGFPIYLTKQYYNFLISVGSEGFSLALNTSGFLVLMVLLFLIILGLAVED